MSSEALEQLCMDNGQILPWIWVIEALASSKPVDTSLLLQLARIIPDKYGEMGKNAREAVLLRILEGLAARDDEENDSISDTGERIKFDPSESCEDVLQHILEDAQASDVEKGGLKMLKWDVQSFISSKRARLDSSVLQKLKDAILEGSRSVIESLKERSGIPVRTRYNNNIPANGGPSDELLQSHEEERGKSIEAVESSKTSNFSSAEKCDDELQENVPEKNLLPAKRKRSHVTDEISERQAFTTITAEACCDPEREAAKKLKQAENCDHDSVGVTITSSQHEIPAKPSENLVENVETEVHRSDKEAVVEDIEFVACPNNMEKRQAYDALTTEDCSDPEREAARKHKQAEICRRHDSVGVTVTSSQHEIPLKPSESLVENVETELRRSDKEADVEDEYVASPNSMKDQEMPLSSPANPVDEDVGRNLSSMQGQNDKIGEGHRGSEGNELRTSNDTLLLVVEAPIIVDKAIEFNHEHHAVGAAETNDHIEHDQDPEATGDSKEYHDETSDMNSMKNAFLSAQCTFSQDSLATQLKLCMKCNNGGKVLVCSSDTCPIVVHESCLGSTVNLDCEGRFYCPFCAYYRAISEYFEVRKRATLARKKLAIFIGHKVDNHKLTMGSDKSKINESKRDDNLSKRNVPNNNRDSSRRINLEDREKTIPTVPCARDKAPCTKKQVDVAREAPPVSENTDLDGENMEQECRPPSRQGVPQNVCSLPLKRLEDVISPDKEKGFCDVNGRDTRTRGSKKIRKESASPAEALHDPPESYEDESDQSVASTHNIKSTRTPNRHTYQGVPQTRNCRRTDWTSVEVEKLKEGVEKFCKIDGVVPWTKILEFGADVFPKDRTAVDLRYKGRAICKQIRKQKRSLIS